jgi:hypothetical protein
MTADVIRLSMNLVEQLLIIGFAFAAGFFVGIWVRS